MNEAPQIDVQQLELKAQTWNALMRARLKLSPADYEKKVRGKDWILDSREALEVGAVDELLPLSPLGGRSN